MRLLLPILAPLALALPTLAAPAAASSASAADSKPVNIADQNKQICKKTETTGTRLGIKRTCKTKADWDAEGELARTELQRNIELGSAATPR